MEFQHELIIPNEGLPFKLFLFEGRNGNYVREKHWHTSIEIFTVMEGSLFFYIDEVEYPLKAGEFLIINSNEVHSIQAPVRNETILPHSGLFGFTAEMQGREKTFMLLWYQNHQRRIKEWFL